MNRIFNNLSELMNALGAVYEDGQDAENDRRLARRIYKDTSCGAWAKVIPAGMRPGPIGREQWSAVLQLKADGVHVYSVIDEDGKEYDLITAPIDVLAYLCVGSRVSRMDLGDLDSLKFFNDPAAYDRDVYRVVDLSPNSKQVTFTLDRRQQIPHAGGVLVGSIVEGSEAEFTCSPLYFPIAEKNWDQAIEWLEGECDLAWREANLPEDEDDDDSSRDQR